MTETPHAAMTLSEAIDEWRTRQESMPGPGEWECEHLRCESDIDAASALIDRLIHRIARLEFDGDAPPIGSRRFTVYRNGDLSATHNEDQVRPPDEPQFEGVVFSDGHCVVRWLTLSHSTAVWPDFDEMWRIHGHDAPDQPHGTRIVWHD